MAYFSTDALAGMGFKTLGKNVKISDKASIYNPELIAIDDHTRVDDFCILSGNISIGKYCHITPMCIVAGGAPGIRISDFCTLAYGVKVFAQSDDYSGTTMANSLIPKKFKNEFLSEVVLERQVIVGAGAVIFPGVTIKEGCSVGAMTLINKSTQPWGIYAGNPGRRIKERKKDLLTLEAKFLKEQQDDSI